MGIFLFCNKKTKSIMELFHLLANQSYTETHGEEIFKDLNTIKLE